MAIFPSAPPILTRDQSVAVEAPPRVSPVAPLSRRLARRDRETTVRSRQDLRFFVQNQSLPSGPQSGNSFVTTKSKYFGSDNRAGGYAMTGSLSLIILVIVLALGALWLVGAYNRLVAFKNRVANAFAQIDVQLKRRHDLIPNLVEVARKYMSHERETLQAVVEARNKASDARAAAAANPADPQTIAALSATEGALGGALGRLFAVSENYPELKASANMAQLSEELTTTENKVAFARQAFNDAVMNLNTAIASFPAVLFAPAMGFQAASMLESTSAPEERQAPQVQF